MRLSSCAVVVFAFACGCGAPPAQPERPANWPDLSVLANYPNPHGDTCSEDGTTKKGDTPEYDKLQENHLKNRYVPPSSYNVYDVGQMLKLPSHEDPNLEHSGAALTGYVEDVKPGGTDGESCNCNARAAGEI